MEKSKDAVLVFEDDWCLIWYNDYLQTVAIDYKDHREATVVLSLTEWWQTSAKILRVRNGDLQPAELNGQIQIPKVPAKLSRNRITFTVRCPFCDETHIHGAGADGNLYGHRSAHCRNVTPESAAGYELIPEKI